MDDLAWLRLEPDPNDRRHEHADPRETDELRRRLHVPGRGRDQGPGDRAGAGREDALRSVRRRRRRRHRPRRRTSSSDRQRELHRRVVHRSARGSRPRPPDPLRAALRRQSRLRVPLRGGDDRVRVGLLRARRTSRRSSRAGAVGGLGHRHQHARRPERRRPHQRDGRRERRESDLWGWGDGIYFRNIPYASVDWTNPAVMSSTYDPDDSSTGTGASSSIAWTGPRSRAARGGNADAAPDQQDADAGRRLCLSSKKAGSSDGTVATMGSQIFPIPNPYYNRSSYELTQFDRVLRFANLPPAPVTIRIFDVGGDLVRTHTARRPDPGDPRLGPPERGRDHGRERDLLLGRRGRRRTGPAGNHGGLRRERTTQHLLIAKGGCSHERNETYRLGGARTRHRALGYTGLGGRSHADRDFRRGDLEGAGRRARNGAFRLHDRRRLGGRSGLLEPGRHQRGGRVAGSLQHHELPGQFAGPLRRGHAQLRRHRFPSACR